MAAPILSPIGLAIYPSERGFSGRFEIDFYRPRTDKQQRVQPPELADSRTSRMIIIIRLGRRTRSLADGTLEAALSATKLPVG